MSEIICGDARELSKDIPDNSIDLIFTDPPYLRENIEDGIYEWLAVEAKRVLKPGGFCLVYTGVYWLADVFKDMQPSLEYYWTFALLHHGGHPYHYERKISNGYKPIIAFSKGKGVALRGTLDRLAGPHRDKQFHKWGQDAYVAQYYLNCFSRPEDKIWDPFCGGGTIPMVCKQLHRDFIAYEIEPDIANIARKRLEIVQPLLTSEESTDLELWEVPA